MKNQKQPVQEAKMTLPHKLLSIQAMNIVIPKTKFNKYLGNYYAPLDKICSVYVPILTGLWIWVYHETKDGEMKTVLYDTETWESIDTVFALTPWRSQEIGSQISYAKRYNLWQLLNIITDEDDDWNTSSWVDAPKKDVAKSTETPVTKEQKEFLKAVKDELGDQFIEQLKQDVGCESISEYVKTLWKSQFNKLATTSIIPKLIEYAKTNELKNEGLKKYL